MSDLKALVRSTLNRYGKDAAAHFGVAAGTLASYKKTGKFPLSFVEKVLADASQHIVEPMVPEPSPQPEPEEFPEPLPMASPPRPNHQRVEIPLVEKRVDEITQYLQTTVDFYIRQFNSRIQLLERTVAAISAARLRAAGFGGSMARPDQGVPVDQTFTTNPNAIFGHPQDTGIAPTKEQVDAQANMMIMEGVPVPNAQIAGPAKFIPDLPAYGFGWNKPRPPR